MFRISYAILTAERLVFLWHIELLAGNKPECGIEVLHRHYERMHGAPVLKVSHKSYGKILKCALGLVDLVQVQHRIRRMLVSSVTGIDYRHIGDLCGIQRSPLKKMAHHYEVRIIAHHLYGVLQGLTLGC